MAVQAVRSALTSSRGCGGRRAGNGNSCVQDGHTALHLAVLHNKRGLLRLLLTSTLGNNLEIKAKDNVRSCHVLWPQVVVRRLTDVRTRAFGFLGPQRGFTPETLAASLGETEVAQWLRVRHARRSPPMQCLRSDSTGLLGTSHLTHGHRRAWCAAYRCHLAGR